MTSKYRTWDKVAEDMFIPEALELDKYGKVTGIFSKGTMFSIEDFELLQSTGLKDKNDKEIFEGDILKENSMLGIVKFGRYLDYEYIQYGLDGWLFSEKLKLGFVDTPLTEYVLDPHCSIEVIGNIYEHPHLLEEE